MRDNEMLSLFETNIRCVLSDGSEVWGFHSDQNIGRQEMFYLTTHSTHFYLRLYGIRHMVKDHSDSEKGNPLPLLFPINSKGSFICTIHQTG